MNSIDKILERLQSAEQPEIDNPDELTERIMKSLDATDSSSKVTTLLPIVRAILSIAALWIIGFFIYLQFDDHLHKVPLSLLPSLSGEGSGERPGRGEALGERPRGEAPGASTLREVYKKRLCADCKNTISYTQLRSKLYENK